MKKKDFVCFDGELLLLLRVSHIEKLWDAAGAKLGIADYKSMRRAAAAEADKKRKRGKLAWRRSAKLFPSGAARMQSSFCALSRNWKKSSAMPTLFMFR